jgi:hypothetical protein
MVSGIVQLDDEAALIGSEKVAEIDEQFARPNNSAESHVVLLSWTRLDTSLWNPVDRDFCRKTDFPRSTLVDNRSLAAQSVTTNAALAQHPSQPSVREPERKIGNQPESDFFLASFCLNFFSSIDRIDHLFSSTEYRCRPWLHSHERISPRQTHIRMAANSLLYFAEFNVVRHTQPNCSNYQVSDCSKERPTVRFFDRY